MSANLHELWNKSRLYKFVYTHKHKCTHGTEADTEGDGSVFLCSVTEGNAICFCNSSRKIGKNVEPNLL